MRNVLVALLLLVHIALTPGAASGLPSAVDRPQLRRAHVVDGVATPLSPGRRTASGIAAPDRDDADASFRVETAAGGQTAIGLPVPTDEPSKTVDGGLVYGSGEAVSVTVRAVDVSADEHLAAALQAVIVIEDAAAPTSYAFPLQPPHGGSTRLEPAGSVSVHDRDGRRVGMFATPWAVDAAGQRVRTWFTLADGSLVQHVALTEHTVFPVVADPFFVVPALVVGGRVLVQIGATAATRAAASSVATAAIAALPRLSPALLTARPLSLVAKARFDRILKDGTRHYYIRGDARAIFFKITEGGRTVSASTRVATNGHTATLYASTSTSAPTIQINSGTTLYKVRIVP